MHVSFSRAWPLAVAASPDGLACLRAKWAGGCFVVLRQLARRRRGATHPGRQGDAPIRADLGQIVRPVVTGECVFVSKRARTGAGPTGCSCKASLGIASGH